jgi:hypothetical protein
MDENEITQRLRDAGDQPVPGEVRATHLSQMHAAGPVTEKPKRFGRLAVAAAAFVGFAVGSTGFAMAGALPAPAQQVAHDVLSVVQVNVENPRDNHGQCVSAAMKDMDPAASEEARKAAKDEACPKEKGRPPHAGQGKPAHAGEGKGRPAHAGTPGGPKGPRPEWGQCQGPPPWAGKGANTEDKQAFKDQRATCPEVGDEGEAEEKRAEAEAGGTQPPAPQGSPETPDDAQGQAPGDTPPAPADPHAPQDEGTPALPAPLAPGAGSDTQDTDPAEG